MVTHAFDVAATNSWVEYNMDCKHLTLKINETMDLLVFKERLAETLILVGTYGSKKKEEGRRAYHLHLH